MIYPVVFIPKCLGTVDSEHPIVFPDRFCLEPQPPDPFNVENPFFSRWTVYHPSSKPSAVSMFLDVLEMVPAVGAPVGAVRAAYEGDLVKLGLSVVTFLNVRKLKAAKSALSTIPEFLKIRFVSHRITLASGPSFLQFNHVVQVRDLLANNTKYLEKLSEIWTAEQLKFAFDTKDKYDRLQTLDRLAKHLTLLESDVTMELIAMNVFCRLNCLIKGSGSSDILEEDFDRWRDQRPWFLLYDEAASVKRPELWFRKKWAEEAFGEVAEKHNRSWVEWVEDSLNLIYSAVDDLKFRSSEAKVDPVVKTAIEDFLLGKYNYMFHLCKAPPPPFIHDPYYDVYVPLGGGVYLMRTFL